MFIGHFAPAFIAAAHVSKASGPRLTTYFIAAQLVDWAFFTFALVGVEKMRIVPGATEMVPYDLYHMPYTHSLLGTLAWGAVFALLVLARTRYVAGAVIAALVVVSHWLLDWLTHRPDLTLAGGERVFGLGLWNYPAIAIPLEIAITLGAFLFYLRRTRGPVGPPLVLLTALVAIQAIAWFGPEPVAAGPALYFTALLVFGVFTLLAKWVADNRYHHSRSGLARANL